jgi:predicted ribonuclease toxin of YeeF-YezG toxin-antitoxin module
MDKDKIDSVWMDSDIGKWIQLASAGKEKEANELYVKIENDIPMNFHNELSKVCKDIAKQFKTEDEFEEYLKILDEENYDMVDFIISNDVFEEVYKILSTK